MTTITRLTAHGFKSFAKRTTIEFTNGFNCVLGPNGSGKSNVIDSLCFVLGRGSSKSLRAEKSANLIYNGGKTKTPAKQGEVSIFFDNSKRVFPSDEKEIKVTRIVRQNGNSLYKLNNKKHTRGEVLEYLSHARINPDGFNIILQGDIVKFTEMPTVERRKIIEEIAGIGIYEEKKNKAVRELEHVEQRLNDAELILKERNSYLRELRKERDQALKFKTLQEKMDTFKASYLNIQIQRLEKQHNELQSKIDDEQKKIETAETQIKELKKSIEEKKNGIESISKEIEEKGEKEQVNVHKEIEQLKVELAKKSTRIDNLKQEIEKIMKRKVQLKTENEEQLNKCQELEVEKQALQKQAKEKQANLLHLEDSLKKFRSKHGMDDASEIEKEIEVIEKQSEEQQKKIAEVRQEQQDLLRRKDQIEFQLKTLDERLEKVGKVKKAHEAQIKDLKNRKELFKKATLALNQALSDDSSFSAQLQTARNRLQLASDKALKARSKAMQAREQSQSSVAIQKITENMKGVHGTVAELGTVNAKYSTALEIAAGGKIHSIVVDDDKVARDCIMYLKSNRLGVATFIPLNKIKSKPISTANKANGVHGLALDLVDYSPKYKKVFEYVFGDTVVVDTIDVARRVGIGTAKMVTLDGDMADISGAMRGGHLSKRKASFSAKEAKEDLAGAEEEAGEQQRLVTALQRRRAENEENIVKFRKEKGELEGEIIVLEKSLHLEHGDLDASLSQKSSLGEELKEVEIKLKSIQTDISAINRQLATTAMEKQKLRTKISELRNPRLVAELHTFEEKKTQLKERLIQIDAELKNVDTKTELMEGEQQKIEEILKQHDKELQEYKEEATTFQRDVTEGEKSLKEKEIAAKKFYAKYKALFADRSKLNDEVSKLDNRVDTLRDVSRKFEISMNTRSLENARVTSELTGLQQQFEPFKETTLVHRPELELKQEISKFERLVNTMGAVNMKALEVYDAVEKEYQSLQQKKESLHTEKDDVLAMINEIETKKSELFMKSFDVVKQNFQTIFASLTTKGEASLVLENSENVFEGGIQIKVRLTGTRFLDIRSLSGGEKTLTALAFIFSIQEHQPHSFYVLDEVDAALDKHNSEKLAKLVRQYCKDAQYVVISHNDAVITEADALYGISMNEHGITNVTSLKV